MCISIDFHGSLNRLDYIYPGPIAWKKILKLLMKEGVKVHVISGNWEHELFSLLTKCGYEPGVHYEDMHSVLSSLKSSGIHTWFDENLLSYHADEKTWWLEKAEICKRIGSKIHFDSDDRFADGFKKTATRFVHTMSASGRMVVKGMHDCLVRSKGIIPANVQNVF
jgi:hypothetical protein